MRKSCIFIIGILLALALATLTTTKAQNTSISYQLIWTKDISYISDIDIAPDGSRIVASNMETLFLLDKNGNVKWAHSDVYIFGVSITPDGQYILYAMGNDFGGTHSAIVALDELAGDPKNKNIGSERFWGRLRR